MRNSLQDQLLKSGLVNEKKIKEANRARDKQKKQAGKSAAQPEQERRHAQQALRDKAEADRALARKRNAAQFQREMAAQIAQLVQHYRQPRGGDIAYNFVDGGVIKKLNLSATLREQLIRGQLVIVRAGTAYELVPVAAGERIRSRDASAIVVWNTPAADQPAADDPYKDYPIPDDLMW